jgi:hypothetical protein
MDSAMIHVMLPVQYLQARQRRMEPQKRLMVAVLETVLDDFRSAVSRCAAGLSSPADRRAYEQARAYVASTDRSWPFSFENICEAIGLDADGLREKLDVLGARE